MVDSNTKTMAVKEEVEHSSSFAEVAPRHEHVVIQTDTFAVDEAALGEHLPKHYYRSVGFIGTVVVSLLLPWHDKADPCRHYVLEISATTWAGSCLRTPSL